MVDLGWDCLLIANGSLHEDGLWLEGRQCLELEGLEQARMCPLRCLWKGVRYGLLLTYKVLHLARQLSH
jgi:hypothetical protein